MLARLARLSVDSLHYLKTGFPNKAALRLPCGVANRRITSGYLWSVLSWVAISRYADTVNVELRRNFAVVNSGTKRRHKGALSREELSGRIALILKY
jgi:hypothetical protein